MITSTLTKSGRAAIAKSLSERKIHFAWGSGVPEWDTDPDLSSENLSEQTALVSELGRRSAIIGFVEPDPQGEITVPVGVNSDNSVRSNRYSQVPGPSAWLYLRTTFDFDDASQEQIREVGIFIDTVVNPDLPEGQRYFLPADLVDPGLLLSLQRRNPPILRSESIRQSFEFVLPV